MKYHALFLVLSLILLTSVAKASDEFSETGKSLVEFTIDFQIPHSITDGSSGDSKTVTKLAPKGSTFRVIGRSDSTFKFRLVNINTKKYMVKAAGTEVKDKSPSLPDIFNTLFKGALSGINKVTEDPKAKALSMDFNGAIAAFDASVAEIEQFSDFLNEMDNVSKKSETYQELLAGIKTAGTKYEIPVNDWLGDTQKVDDEVNKTAGKIDNLATLLKNVKDLKGQDNVTQDYAYKSAVRIYENTVKLRDKLDDVRELIKTYLNQDKTKEVLFTWTSEDIKYSSGTLNVKLEVTPQEGANKSTVYRVDFDITTENRQFFDFAPGVFFSFLHDQSFTTATLTNPANNQTFQGIVRKGAENRVTTGVGALLHYGYMFRRELGIATSFGVSGQENNFQYYVGGSLLLGRQRRFIITSGLAIGSVKRLDGYNLGDAFTGATVPTKSVTDTGGFVSISFRF